MNNTIWLYGLPSAGKTTLALKLIKYMRNNNKPVIFLDGDDMRFILSPDLGFTERDRSKQTIKLFRLSNLINKNCIDTIVCTNSPSKKSRDLFRNNIDNLIEIYVECPLDICIKRDTKGLYKKAKAGLIKNMPGLDMKYETPVNPDIIINTSSENTGECIKKLVAKLWPKHYL